MDRLERLSPSPALSGPWFRSSRLLSGAMEAVSFATPTLERFFMRTVAGTLPRTTDLQARAQALRFVREEGRHARAHRRFNVALSGYLDGTPPALTLITRALDAVERSLSLQVRLLLVAVLEDMSGSIAGSYLRRQRAWRIDCPYARVLFARHAREELQHGRIIDQLRSGLPKVSSTARIFCFVAVASLGGAYLCIAVAWIMARKPARRAHPEKEQP